MAWAEQLPSGNWRACWRDSLGHTRSTTLDPDTRQKFTRKSHAERIAGSKETDARKGLATADGRAPRWKDWMPYWLEARVVEPQTAGRDDGRIKRYILPKWGDQRINTITRREVQLWANELCRETAKDRETPISPSTVQRVIHLFSASMKAAVLDERVPIAANPCVAIELPPPDAASERFLTRDEVDAIAFHLSEPYKSAWFILCGTGLRFGELAGLHVNRVDMERRTVTVIDSWDSEAREIKPYPKAKKPRTVPIPAWLVPVFEQLLAAHPDQVGCGLPHRRGVKCRSRLVVPAQRGGALDAHNFGRRDFATAVDLAKVEPCHLHDARHTYASWLVQAGVLLQEVQRLLGHASIITTQRYAKLGTSQNEKVLAALEARPAKKQTQPRATPRQAKAPSAN